MVMEVEQGNKKTPIFTYHPQLSPSIHPTQPSLGRGPTCFNVVSPITTKCQTNINNIYKTCNVSTMNKMAVQVPEDCLDSDKKWKYAGIRTHQNSLCIYPIMLHRMPNPCNLQNFKNIYPCFIYPCFILYRICINANTNRIS